MVSNTVQNALYLRHDVMSSPLQKICKTSFLLSPKNYSIFTVPELLLFLRGKMRNASEALF